MCFATVFRGVLTWGMDMRWVSEWRKVISEEFPCGQDVSFGSEFELLQDEIEKGISIYADNSTDWDVVFSCATSILGDLSKDISVLCYGSRASFEKGGIPWLVESITILSDYLEAAWEGLHPQRHGRRIAALQWLGSKLEALSTIGSFSSEEESAVCEALRESLVRLQKILDAQLGDASPSFSAIIHALPKPAYPNPQAEPVVQAPLTNAPAFSRIPAQPETRPSPDSTTIVSADVLAQINRMTADQTRRLALHYLSLNYTDWRAYLLNRVALWTTIPQLPQVGEGLVTTLRPIPKDKQHAYQSAIQSRQYAAILHTLERSAANQPYWLDGHFMVCQCLEGLGADAAKEAICCVLRPFIKLFPEITSFKYFDKTPFAAPATLQWIEKLEQEKEVIDDSGTSWLPDASVDARQQSEYAEEELLHSAIEKGRAGGFEAGLGMFGSNTGQRSRSSVRRALLQARYCMVMNKPKTARQLLTAIYRQLEQWGLIEWEPELSAQVIALLASLQKGNHKEHDEMIRKLYWLHFETAVKVIPEKSN